MEPVVTVNLGGNAYQLDQSAHEALRAYLDAAAAALADNPDKAEILRDLEQAIADKANACLSAYKNVVGADEMAEILQQMGPVEGADAANEAPRRQSAPRALRKLYRLRDRQSVTGVSAGLAAYFDLDVNLIRLLWIFGALFSGGFLILAYIALMFWMPLASTPEEIAAVHGAPFNAQDVIERAQRNFEEFADEGARSWRAWRRDMREARLEARRAEARAWAQTAPPPAAGPFAVVTRIFGAIFAIVFSLLGAALLIAFLIALFSLITTGAVLGWAPPASVPFWAAIVILCVVYGALAGPVAAIQGASYSALHGRRSGRFDGDGGFGALLVLLVLGWVIYTYIPEGRAWMDYAWLQIRAFFASLPSPH